ncbi:peptide/nickel transport system permease protein [Salana multivorans]|uniref:Peptide/nickel transport system permease protein n=1 Tax=Salana multivorans TaxID=120377 RepID=A0A3N2DBJ1_9MICO|nr:ABC transporter permease [Salana multivorans]MBN9189687.1 ABC transporter permease [Microbacterium sp.]OJX95997.1 MAG: peptide ABC transporter permease [Micrococcales bacterium 73-15]ROR97165.1 peptide/nickel transport system permease protein [Salana multivorans]
MSVVQPQLGPEVEAREVGTTATAVVKGRSRIPWRFLGGRAAFYLFTLWAAVTINFFLPRMMKGDAVTSYLSRNRNVTPEAADALRSLLGLDTDKSLLQQYVDYLGLLLRGDLGVSLLHGLRPVTEVIGQALPWTVGLVGFATIVSFTIGTVGGAVVGWRRGSRLDALIPITTFLGTIPYFWLGLLAIALFSVNLGWFPIGKAYGVGMKPEWSLEFIGQVIHHGTLPAATIVIASLGGWMLGMRNMMLTVLDEDYITVAQAKGMPNRRVLWRYAARNAVLPQIQSFALSIGFIVGGTIVMEMVFSYPGVGKLLLDATNAKDYALMQGVFLVITLSVLVANILADVAYAFLDPRTRQTEA